MHDPLKRQQLLLRWEPLKRKPAQQHLDSRPAKGSGSTKRQKVDPTVPGKGQVVMFYPLYSGWAFPDLPILFKEPGQAMTWSLGRFKKDCLSNIFGPGSYPGFMMFVGCIHISPKSLVKSAMPGSKRSFMIEKFFLRSRILFPG